MADRQGLKSGILFIILGLGLSMCSPVLYLLSRAAIEQNRVVPKISIAEKQGSLHAEELPHDQESVKKQEVRYTGRAQVYIQRYLASKRLFPRAFFIQSDATGSDTFSYNSSSQLLVNQAAISGSIPSGRLLGPYESEINQAESGGTLPHSETISNSSETTETGSDLQTNPSVTSELSNVLPVLSHSQVLAFYGKPGSRAMGILGQYTKEQLAPILEKLSAEYDSINGALGIVPAFYIIFGTCWPEGNIGYVSKAVVKEYIEFAKDRGWLVFLDHQIGKYDVIKSLETMYEFLQYPNVHLALDPEWRTTKPMQEIGYVTGDEINKAQESFQNYLTANKLPGPRMLVIHQFKPKMIMNRDAVKATYDQVVLVHVADGFGNPQLKKVTYNMVAGAQNIPVKGFKLFYPPAISGAGWDNPLMNPKDVLSLQPMPLVIMYQ